MLLCPSICCISFWAAARLACLSITSGWGGAATAAAAVIPVVILFGLFGS
jgi:hypothetical protein